MLFAAFAIVFTAFSPPKEAEAATPIRIFIDGQILTTDQPPVAIAGYTMVPMRAIFEALNARIQWNQKAQTVTATKRDTTIVLTLGSKTATINNSTVTLDSPARAIGGRTMVPVRFVSEALGEEVRWVKESNSVQITTKSVKEVKPATSLAVSTVSSHGDGRDLRVSFAPPSDQTNVTGYRILVVKANQSSSFNLAKAQAVGSANYTAVSKSSGSGTRTTTLSAQSRDVDGALLRANQAYRVFVLTVGSDMHALSSPSVSISLTASPSVNAATNVKIDDIADFGDGRDLRVTFTKASNESNITGYRVMIVKTSQASSFDLAKANGISSSYYTNVSKTSSSGPMSVTLSSSARDTSGDSIKNGVGYTAFVLALSSNTGSLTNALSTGSSSVTLEHSGILTVSNLTISDIADHNNGRDLQVSFTKAANESNIRNYRIFVVRDANASSFNLASANAVTNSGYYTTVNKGSDIRQALAAGARDVNGSLVQNNVAYRVFVMSVGTKDGNNALSQASNALTLSPNNVTAVTNVTVSDVGDNNNGTDLRVSFTKASNETNIAHYRVFVVKEAFANHFNLDYANANNNYTIIHKKSSNIAETLNADSRDTDGVVIQNGVRYRVFVLSYSGNNNYGNALSAASPVISLANTGIVTAATNVAARDVADYGDGRDLEVSFTKATSEINIREYRIFVVPNNTRFNLNDARGITDSNRYTVARTGSDVSTTLGSGARDINNQPIKNDVNYQVYVLSVGVGPANGTFVLSSPSPSIKLTISQAQPVTGVAIRDIGDTTTGADMQVSFTKTGNESNIQEYRIFIVRSGTGLTLNQAISATGNYTVVGTGGSNNVAQTLSGSATDTSSNLITNGVDYQAYVLSVARSGTSALAGPSASVRLTSPVQVSAVTNLGVLPAEGKLILSWSVPPETGISHYAVLVSGSSSSLAATTAHNLYTSGRSAVTVNRGTGLVDLNTGAMTVEGAAMEAGKTYYVYVLSVADGTNATIHNISGPVAGNILPPPSPDPVNQESDQTPLTTP